MIATVAPTRYLRSVDGLPGEPGTYYVLSASQGEGLEGRYYRAPVLYCHGEVVGVWAMASEETIVDAARRYEEKLPL